MLAYLDRHLAPWHLWAGLLAVVALDLSMLLLTVPRLEEFASGPMFDLRPGGYEADDANAYLTALGAAGRDYYASAHVPVDMAFAILEAIVLAMLIVWFTRPGARFAVPVPEWGRWLLLAFPVLAAIYDVRENMLVLEMLRAGDQAGPGLIAAASFATQAKWLFAVLSIGSVLVLALWAAIRAKRNARV